MITLSYLIRQIDILLLLVSYTVYLDAGAVLDKGRIHPRSEHHVMFVLFGTGKSKRQSAPSMAHYIRYCLLIRGLATLAQAASNVTPRDEEVRAFLTAGAPTWGTTTASTVRKRF